MKLENLDKNFNLGVPEGYFRQMEEQILARINISEMTEIENPQVPQDYFEKVEENILSLINLEKQIGRQEFTVPDNYFEEMEEQIISRVKIVGLEQPNVDQGYFDELEENILAAVSIDAMQQLEYEEATAAYFDQLESEILNKTKESKKSQFKILRNFSFSRGAAAAVIVGLIAFGLSFLNIQNKDEFADVTSESIIAYLSDQILDQEDLSFILEDESDEYYLIDEISDADIKSYLQDYDI